MKNVNLSLSLLLLIAITHLNCSKELSCDNCPPALPVNKAPLPAAGSDQVIFLPANSVLLDGTGSSDADGQIISYAWKKVAGPVSFNITSPSASKTSVTNLVSGVYLFELQVTDNGNLSATDTVKVTVTLSGNRPPVAKAGADQTIILPGVTAVLDGSASTDPDNNITSYLWTKVSGPSSYSFINQNAALTQVINLVEGDYLFELKVTDAGSLFDSDTMKVSVIREPSTPLVDIYVAGSNNNIPVYWKNGQENLLNGIPVGYAATSIVVDGSNLCIAASRWGLLWTEYEAKYWKNGVVTPLGNHANAYSVAVSGNDVFVAGFEFVTGGYIAKYWKNGQDVPLNNVSNQSEANCIVVVGPDVYIAGSIGDAAVYWKNGQVFPITNGSNQAYAYSIAVVGNDIYVAGAVGNVATYWKNGQAISLTNGTKRAVARSIVIKGNDVYVAGWEGDTFGSSGGSGSVAKYWKNGQVVSLTGGNTYAYANSIAVHGNDVYVAGYEYAGNTSNAKYWKNGQAVQLTNGVNHSRAGDIKVVIR